LIEFKCALSRDTVTAKLFVYLKFKLLKTHLKALHSLFI
jgi:hypothetical protein